MSPVLMKEEGYTLGIRSVQKITLGITVLIAVAVMATAYNLPPYASEIEEDSSSDSYILSAELVTTFPLRSVSLEYKDGGAFLVDRSESVRIQNLPVLSRFLNEVSLERVGAEKRYKHFNEIGLRFSIRSFGDYGLEKSNVLVRVEEFIGEEAGYRGATSLFSVDLKTGKETYLYTYEEIMGERGILDWRISFFNDHEIVFKCERVDKPVSLYTVETLYFEGCDGVLLAENYEKRLRETGSSGYKYFNKDGVEIIPKDLSESFTFANLYLGVAELEEGKLSLAVGTEETVSRGGENRKLFRFDFKE